MRSGDKDKMSETAYIKCPFCGFNKVLYSDSYPDGEFRFSGSALPPSETSIIEIKEALAGPGRGHKIKGMGGFQVVETLNIIEMLNEDRYSEQAEHILKILKHIFDDFIRVGLFDISEFL